MQLVPSEPFLDPPALAPGDEEVCVAAPRYPWGFTQIDEETRAKECRGYHHVMTHLVWITKSHVSVTKSHVMNPRFRD